MRELGGNLKVAYQALQTGKRLKNATGWKWAGLACLAVAFGVPAAVDFLAAFTWYPDWLPQQLDGLYLLSIVSAYAQVATTEKIGLPQPGVAVPLAAPAPDGVQLDEMPANSGRAVGGADCTSDRAGQRDAVADALGNFNSVD